MLSRAASEASEPSAPACFGVVDQGREGGVGISVEGHGRTWALARARGNRGAAVASHSELLAEPGIDQPAADQQAGAARSAPCRTCARR